ncbi:MAG: hypothetical protein FJW95_12900 [Actinobacteria bacterium]|nr:hypothetical protein [Actinomycetota bacterium]
MIELVDPRGTPEPRAAGVLAPRPARLTRVGFLVNEPGRVSGPSFGRYAEQLDGWFRDRLGVTDTVTGFKPVLSRRADDALLDRYDECSAVVNGLAK